MADLHELEARELRARRAAELLENELLIDAWQTVEQEIYKRWSDSPVADVTGQHELRLMLHVMKSVKQQIESVITDGKIAAHERKSFMQRVASIIR